MWGVTVTLDMFQKGWSLGKGSVRKTSKHAPATWPDKRAVIKASSSIKEPLPGFIRNDPSGKYAKVCVFIIFCVFGVSGSNKIKICAEFNTFLRSDFL